MKQTLTLFPAPTGMQPGGYVPIAYADGAAPLTAHAELAVETAATGWRITIAWACPAPVRDAARETDRFVDACALLAPATADAPWITMGAPDKPVEGYLWRPDRPEPWLIRANGLGTVRREAAPPGTRATAHWQDGRWRVAFEIPHWPILKQRQRIAVAVWQGAQQERAGLKSISADWTAIG